MEVHVYLHRNGGFPNIFKKCVPVLNHGNSMLEIREMETDEVRSEYKTEDVFRFDTLVDEETK